MTITPLIAMAAGAGSTLVSATMHALEQSPFGELFVGKSEEAEKVHELPPLVSGDIEAGARAALAQFQQGFAAKLSSLGITLSQPLKLAVDSFGRVRAQDDHPQKAEVDQILADNDALSNDFRRAASQMELVRAGREHVQFSKIYAENPELAVAQYQHLFDEKRQPPQFRLLVSGDRAEPLFE